MAVGDTRRLSSSHMPGDEVRDLLAGHTAAVEDARRAHVAAEAARDGGENTLRGLSGVDTRAGPAASRSSWFRAVGQALTPGVSGALGVALGGYLAGVGAGAAVVAAGLVVAALAVVLRQAGAAVQHGWNPAVGLRQAVRERDDPFRDYGSR
ncbi:MAG TPA: hypothetical protein VHH34_23910 [Pseudonocardiaceae bacterium]|nr:hypothetical protein [Pseudonocardiaceae bacterium]